MSKNTINEPELLLAVSFGTSFADTREKTIGAIEKCIQKKLPQCTVRRCFTSRFIRKKLIERDGLYIPGPEEALRDAREKGVRELTVQPLYLMHGFEHRRLMNLLKESEPFFDRILIGKPLLFDASDFHLIVDAICRQIPVEDENTAVVLMGHGNEKRKKPAIRKLSEAETNIPNAKAQGITDIANAKAQGATDNPNATARGTTDIPILNSGKAETKNPSIQEPGTAGPPAGKQDAPDIEDNSVFEVLQRALWEAGADNYYIATVEGEPELKDVLPQIKAHGFKKVILAPFMVVAGDHAQNDLAGDEKDSWKNIFLKNGFEVETVVRGIGEWAEVQELFAAHAARMLQ